MSAVPATVPSFVPDLPFMNSLAQAMLANDPGSISFEPMAANTLGEFNPGDPKHPHIALNSHLRELYLRGLPLDGPHPRALYAQDDGRRALRGQGPRSLSGLLRGRISGNIYLCTIS
jgi:hypothetical protein